MKKVVFLINSLSAGGAERVLSIIANELVREGFDVEMIFLEKNEFYKLDERIQKIYLSKLGGNESSIVKLLYLPILAWRLKQHIIRNNIGLVQSHLYRANYVNILASLLGAKHQTQLVNAGVVSRYLDEGVVGRINIFLMRYLYKKAHLLIWKSSGMKQDANRLFGFKNTQVVINNPYDLNKIQKLCEEDIKDFKFNKDKKYLINVGRMEGFKKQEWLIKAMEFLHEEVELILIGDGVNKKKLRALSDKLNVSKRVHFLGKKHNPFKYLRKSDIFILSSHNGEGFPNALVEALACGLPVISSDCLSGPREILAPDSDASKQLKFDDDIEVAKYGILYPVGNVEKLVEAITLLFKNKELYDNYKKLAKKRAKDFSKKKILEQYERVLNEEASFRF